MIKQLCQIPFNSFKDHHAHSGAQHLGNGNADLPQSVGESLLAKESNGERIKNSPRSTVRCLAPGFAFVRRDNKLQLVSGP